MTQTITAKAFPILFPFGDVCKVFSRQWPDKASLFHVGFVEEVCTIVRKTQDEGLFRYDYAWTRNISQQNFENEVALADFIKACQTIAPPIKNNRNRMIVSVLITCGENLMTVSFPNDDKNKVNIGIKSRDSLLFISQELQHLKKTLKTLESFDISINQ